MAGCGVGLGVGPDLLRAAVEAARAASAPLGAGTPDLACVFVTGQDHAVVEAAMQLAGERVGARTTLGCSAYGVLGAGRAAEAVPSVSVWAAVLPGARTRAFHLEVLREPEHVSVVGVPSRRSDDRAGVLLADPYTFPADGFVGGSTDAIRLPLVGGLAYGPRGAGSVRLMLDGRVVDRGAVGVLLGGEVGLGTLVSQGCRPVGPPMTVTASDGNVLLGLAGVPALDKLRAVVAAMPDDERALAARGLHIGIALDDYADDPGQGDFLVRGIVGADDERGGLAVGDVVEVGRTVQFQVRDAAAATADLRSALARVRAEGDLDPVAGALLFSCNGRGRAFFPDADHDVRLAAAGLGTDRVAGFMASGEIGPVGGRNHLHGQTATLLLVGADGTARPGGRGTRP